MNEYLANNPFHKKYIIVSGRADVEEILKLSYKFGYDELKDRYIDDVEVLFFDSGQRKHITYCSHLDHEYLRFHVCKEMKMYSIFNADMIHSIKMYNVQEELNG